ncbi:hypothetical protein [Streptomyces hygroscopicus]|uniref:hypothetical protein n=1 Tax=Streptomyces hygroscopicus TaxID=1912 RepID=UPI003697AFAB
MALLVLSLLLVAVIGGCGCVWWTSRGGGPRWAQALALVTLTAGEFLRFSAARTRRRSVQGPSVSGDADS